MFNSVLLIILDDTVDILGRILYNKVVLRFDCNPIWGTGLMH